MLAELFAVMAPVLAGAGLGFYGFALGNPTPSILLRVWYSTLVPLRWYWRRSLVPTLMPAPLGR